MSTPRVCVLRAPGTNCDIETAHAFKLAGGEPTRLHLFRLLENPALLADYQILCVPGGFSYGDDVGAGAVFGAQLRGVLANAIGQFLTADKLVLGICNGFQVLVKSGILPGGGAAWPPDPQAPRDLTLTWNDNGRYTATWVKLKVCSDNCVFLRGLDQLELPVAHAEGRLAVRDPAVLSRLASQQQIALAYTDGSDTPYRVDDPVLDTSHNPNGAVANIAGLADSTGRVLGLMPHPERFLFATHHPQWTRRELTGAGTGLKLFENAVGYFA
ncbi:MAG: phosphoribosylformylglycinamidine synthase I [Planctomycetaceae bacterium]